MIVGIRNFGSEPYYPIVQPSSILFWDFPTNKALSLRIDTTASKQNWDTRESHLKIWYEWMTECSTCSGQLQPLQHSRSELPNDLSSHSHGPMFHFSGVNLMYS
jgi:hypothetical protein